MASGTKLKKARAHYKAAIDELIDENLTQALSEIEQAIELSEHQDAGQWAVKSRILVKLRQHRDAETAARRSIEIDASSHDAWMTLGLSSFDRKEFEKAADCFKRAIEIKANYSRYTMLAAAERQFDPQKAKEHAKKALQLNPDWDEAKVILRNAELELKQKPT